MARLPMPFGNPRTYAGHTGIDFPQPRGTLIRASGPGVMGLRNTTPRGGITAWVDYDGHPGVAYAHLDNYQHTPRTGIRVQEGDVIAAVGMSGVTTGPHLHSEVYGRSTTTGYWTVFDPTRYVGQGGGSGGGSNPYVPPSEDEMTPEQANQLAFVYAALAGPANIPAPKMTWARPYGEDPGEAYYGIFDVLLDIQARLKKLEGQ